MSAARGKGTTGVTVWDRIAVWRARGAPAHGFLTEPVPRSIGSVAIGERLLAGEFSLAGHRVSAPGSRPWDLTPPDARFAAALHGFDWLDDLAAVGDRRARVVAQDWVGSWIARYGRGSGPGWTPALGGRRLQRWLHHAQMLLRAAEPADASRLFDALATHTRYLARRAGGAPSGVPRIDALVAQLSAAAMLDGLRPHAERAHRALAAELDHVIDETGAIPTRNPQTLLDMLIRITWAQEALQTLQQAPDPALETAAHRLAGTLRALRHTDGSLARFHGGGRGSPGALDAALAAIRSRAKPREGLAMGYARLTGGRTSLIVDAAPPPARADSADAHASTLAFELTSGRRPLIVNCGAGDAFGAEWRRAGRATPLHSTLCLDGASSAILDPPRKDGSEWLGAAPRRVPVEFGRKDGALTLEAGHDGYVARTGLTHARTLALSRDGRHLSGEDFLVALDAPAKARFEAALGSEPDAGIPFRLHFHLHPDVDVALDSLGTVATMALRSGEIWVLRFEGDATMAIERSVYLQAGRAEPLATSQIVLSGLATTYTTRLRWSLANAQDTGPVVRDLVEDALEDV
jgi:uncharacterized heparinase superfamily protein